MNERTANSFARHRVLFGATMLLLVVLGCHENKAPIRPEDDPFVKEKNAQHNGDYFATYPLHNPDSCLIRIKNEIPLPLQPWACLSIWYRLPRTSPAVSFRLLELYDKNYPHDTVFAFTQMVRGEFLVEMNKLDSAETFLADAKKRYLQLNRPLDASDADFLLARSYFQKNNVAQSLAYHFNVLDLINQHDTAFSHRHAYLYLDIASAYASARDYPKELIWLKKGWTADYSKIEEPWKYQTQFALKMSTNYAQTGLFDSSLVMAKRATEIFSTNSTKPLPAEFNYRTGFAYLKKGEHATALPYLLAASRGSINSPNTFMKNQIDQGLGTAYLVLGKLDSAELFFRAALSTPDSSNLAAAHRSLGEIHAQRGDYKNAYTEEKESSLLFKKVYAIEKATALSEFEARYATAQKELRILELENKHKKQQQQILVLLISVLMAAGLGLYLFFQQRIKHLKNIFDMRTRIADDLHDDVASSLNYLSIMIKSLHQKMDTLPLSSLESNDTNLGIVGRLSQIESTNDEVISKLSDIVWSVSHHSQALGDLIERLQDYGEDILLKNGVPVVFNVQIASPEKHATIIVRQHTLLIYKEAIHNILRHTKSYEVVIQIENKSNELNIQVTNYFSETIQPSNSTGKGLESMQRRMEALRGNLQIEQKEGFFHLKLFIPNIFN